MTFPTSFPYSPEHLAELLSRSGYELLYSTSRIGCGFSEGCYMIPFCVGRTKILKSTSWGYTYVTVNILLSTCIQAHQIWRSLPRLSYWQADVPAYLSAISSQTSKRHVISCLCREHCPEPMIKSPFANCLMCQAALISYQKLQHGMTSFSSRKSCRSSPGLVKGLGSDNLQTLACI